MIRRNDRMGGMDEAFEGIDERSGLPILSRRAMLGGAAATTLAMGGMMLLPKVEGGVLFPIFDAMGPQKAYADDVWFGSFTIDVVGIDEVGFLILDADTITYDSEGNAKGTPVKNATITLTKLPESPTSATVTRYTDDTGKANIPIDAVAVDKKPEDDVYYANVAVRVTTERSRVDYRDFSAGMLALEGASGCLIGIVKPDSTAIYMERCTFDGWDIHYAKNTFLRSKYNTKKHEIKVRFAGTTDDVAVTLNIKDAKNTETLVGPLAATATMSKDSGFVECTFSGEWLRSGSKDCITADEAHLCFDYTPKGQKTISVPIPIGVQDAPIDTAKLDGGIIPFLTDENSFFDFTASGDWPVFNGLSFSVMNPKLPLQLATTPMYVAVGFGTDVPMFDDKGNFDPGQWMEWHTTAYKDRFEGVMRKQRRDWTNRNGDVIPEGGIPDPDDLEFDEPVVNPETKAVATKSRFLKNFNVTFIGRVTFAIQFRQFEYEDKDVKSKFEGSGCVELGFSAGGSVTIPFQAGPLPMYFSASLTLTALGGFTEKVAARVLKSKRYIDCAKDLVYDYDHNGSLLLKLVLMGSLGVGWHGIASLSCDNTFEFPFLFAWGPKKEREGKANPHIVISVTIRMEIVVQCQLFRFSGQIFSYTKKGWFDNWHGKSANGQNDTDALTGDSAWSSRPPRFRLTQRDGSFRHSFGSANGFSDVANPFDTAVPVTDEQMHAARDADASQRNGYAAKEFSATAESGRFEPVGSSGRIFIRRNDGIGDSGTSVFKDTLPKPVVKDKTVGTELVDCPGTTTFYFGSAQTEKELIAIAGAASIFGASSADGSARAGTELAAATTLIAGGAPQDAPRFEGDPMLGFALGSEDVYVYTPTAGKTTGAYCGSSNVKAISALEGIVPTVDVAIYENVYSDPRQRVVTIGGIPYLFRIATVTYTLGSQTFHRSRVVASAFDMSAYKWLPPKVIEYNTNSTDLPRDDMFDYEFDIAVRTGDEKWTRDVEACLIVVGGTRDGDAKTDIHEAFANPTVAIVLLDADLSVVDRSVQSVKDVCGDGVHMLCSPCIVDGFASGGATGVFAYAFLHRSASTASGLTEATATVTFEVGYCYVRDNYLCFPKQLKTGSGLDGSVFGVTGVTGDAVAGQYDGLLTLLFQRRGGYDVYTATIPPGGSFLDLVIRHNISGSEVLPEIQPWPHHGTYLFVKSRPATIDSAEPDFHLYQGSFDVMKEGATGFAPEKVDSSGFKGSTFCVSPSGEFIFYHESYADDPNDDPKADQYSSNVALDDNGEPVSDGTVYRISASRFINGAFCQDFPFCELSHPVDRIEVLNIDRNASTFVATHITDADKSLADLYYVAVPNTLAAEIEGFAPTGAFVYAGGLCEFQVDVRNHGNLIISGFYVRMLDPGDHSKEIGKVWVGEPEPEQIVLTAANADWPDMSDSDSPMFRQSEDEAMGWLMPGELVSYKATFEIPDTWKDSKTVVMCISDAKTPGVSAELDVQAAEHHGGEHGGIIHFYHQGAENTLHMGPARGLASVQHPVETVAEDETDTQKKSAAGAAKTTAKTTPNTGDPLGITEALTAALGGAAALLAGYSARRAKIEREEQEGSGG